MDKENAFTEIQKQSYPQNSHQSLDLFTMKRYRVFHLGGDQPEISVSESRAEAEE